MKNLLDLAWQRFRVSLRSRIAAIVIVAAVATAWLLYWGYTQAMGRNVVARVEVPDLPSDVVLSSPRNLAANISTLYMIKTFSYVMADLETPFGQLPVGAVTSWSPDAGFPNPNNGEVWLPKELMQKWDIQTGDPFPIGLAQDFQLKTLPARVAGSYAAPSFNPVILVSEPWAAAAGLDFDDYREVFFYNRNMDNTAQNALWLRNLPRGVSLVTANSVLSQAESIVKGTFSSGGSAVALLFLFMALGVGTFSMLSYMDGRRELAVLKSMGLRPAEAGGLFIAEGLATAVLGVGVSLFIVGMVGRFTTVPISISLNILLKTTLLTMVALVLATGVPYLLAKQAGVIELMLGRPVPIIRKNVTGLTKRRPSLESFQAAGCHCIVLPTSDGADFSGICFRHAGQRVKQAETVAWESFAWGLGERSYLATCDGKVIESDMRRGLVVISPTD